MKTLILSLFILSNVFAINPGEKAPDFNLTDQNGKKIKLSDFKGKTVVLEWYNQDCPFVRKHYNPNNMQGLQKKYTIKEVVWLSINSSAKGKQGHIENSAAAQNTIKKESSHQTHLLLDPTGEVGQAYGAKTTPHMFIVNSEGILAYNGAIDSIRSANSDDITKADNYVALGLDAIIAGKSFKNKKTSPYGCSVKY